jgi:hypothetical protein
VASNVVLHQAHARSNLYPLAGYKHQIQSHGWWSKECCIMRQMVNMGHPPNNFVSSGHHDLFKNFRTRSRSQLLMWQSCWVVGPCYTDCVITRTASGSYQSKTTRLRPLMHGKTSTHLQITIHQIKSHGGRPKEYCIEEYCIKLLGK